MSNSFRKRRLVGLLAALLVSVLTLLLNPSLYQPIFPDTNQPVDHGDKKTGSALVALQSLAVKGRAPKTGYERSNFGSGWSSKNGCDTRNIILARDLENEFIDDECKVQRGQLHDPYTGKTIDFVRGENTSQEVQIDHVVALSNSWQTGAQQLTPERREQFANDPLELLATYGPANQEKSDGDAATWLPSNKSFRCQYVARQIAVKKKYNLWVTQPEKQAMKRVLSVCPSQGLPSRN